MSNQGAASSNVDMLRLEYPQTITEIVNYVPSDDCIEIHEPPVWMRQMIHQYTQARKDHNRMYNACRQNIDRNDRRILKIEQNYKVLADGIRYVYDQAKSDATATHEWIQTELTATAQATQELAQQIWQVICSKNEEDGKKEMLQKMEHNRIEEAFAFM